MTALVADVLADDGVGTVAAVAAEASTASVVAATAATPNTPYRNLREVNLMDDLPRFDGPVPGHRPAPCRQGTVTGSRGRRQAPPGTLSVKSVRVDDQTT